jgi:hypothetical protein
MPAAEEAGVIPAEEPAETAAEAGDASASVEETTAAGPSEESEGSPTVDAEAATNQPPKEVEPRAIAVEETLA